MSAVSALPETQDIEPVLEKRKLGELTDATDSEQESKRRKKEAKAKKVLESAELEQKEKQALLSWRQKCEIQDLDFGPDEEKLFEKIRKKLANDAAYRKKYPLHTCGNILNESALGLALITDTDRKKCQARLQTRKLPLQLLRVASARKGSDPGHRSTNGLDRLDKHIPAKVVKKKEMCYPELLDVPHAREMLGCRFLWDDRRWDETLSWTQSMLFVIVLATCREYKGQEDITIYLIDSDEARRPANRSCISNTGTSQVLPTEFHFGPDLMHDLDIPGLAKWNPFARRKLQSYWFTHEFISHHEVTTATGSYQARLPDLITAGLSDFLPELTLANTEHLKGLYDRCVHARSLTFWRKVEGTEITQEELHLANALARCFLPPGPTSDTAVAPLHLLLTFLGLRRRPLDNPALQQWVREHYTASHILSLEYNRSLRVANNLPEIMQMLALGREACIAWGLVPFEPTRVWPVDPDFSMNGLWLKDGPKEIKVRDSRKKSEKLQLGTGRAIQLGSGRAIQPGTTSATSFDGTAADAARDSVTAEPPDMIQPGTASTTISDRVATPAAVPDSDTAETPAPIEHGTMSTTSSDRTAVPAAVPDSDTVETPAPIEPGTISTTSSDSTTTDAARGLDTAEASALMGLETMSTTSSDSTATDAVSDIDTAEASVLSLGSRRDSYADMEEDVAASDDDMEEFDTAFDDSALNFGSRALPAHARTFPMDQGYAFPGRVEESYASPERVEEKERELMAFW